MLGSLNQVATWWAQGSMDGFGKRGFLAPESIFVRWQDESRLMIAKMEEQISSDAQVWFSERGIIKGDYFALGDYTGVDEVLPEIVDPTTLDTAYIVQDLLETPSVEADEYLNKALLKHNIRF